MPTSARYPDGRSQHFTFAQRNFLWGLALGILQFPSFQSVPLAFGRCKPEFSIGDEVRTSWEADGVSRSESGHVVGICWHPTHKHWEYLVVWGSAYFDEQLTDAKGLELNNHA
jgi:hypothetical protein